METEKMMERIGPYLSDLDGCRKVLEEAITSEDPVEFLEERLRSSEGLMKADIRIMLNHFK